VGKAEGRGSRVEGRGLRVERLRVDGWGSGMRVGWGIRVGS
jgi:hypothetical protein